MIDEVESSDFVLLAKDLGIGVKHLRSICSDAVDSLSASLAEAGERGSSVIESLPYSAEDVIEDMQPRIEVVTSFARRS